MEVVVYLALFMLASVFCFSLLILIIMCRRRVQTKKCFRATTSLRFTKIDGQNAETLVQLEPIIAQVLDNNQWIYDVSGMLQHCVVVLKLCHVLTEKLSGISQNSMTPKLNKQVVAATTRIMPRFDDLMRTLAASQVDVCLLVARTSSLVSAFWALAFPFTIISSKHVDFMEGILNEMEDHVEALRFAVLHIEQKNPELEGKRIRKSSLSLTTVIEETPLLEPSSTDRNNSTTESQQSDEAPADPVAPATT